MQKYIFNFELNRRVPNGMHGGVRGRFISPYSIGYTYKTRRIILCILSKRNFEFFAVYIVINIFCEEVICMKDGNSLPLLLLDNSSMMSVLNEGEFKCFNLSFEEAKHILEIHDEADVLRCFSNSDIETIIFDYLGCTKRNFEYKHIRNMRPGQDAIAFKLYITPSKTQPVIQADDGVEAKKIYNTYVYCQHITRLS